MNNNYTNIEDLIAKHLAGETTPAEKAMLEEWLAEAESNRDYFRSLEKIFMQSATAKPGVDVDTDAAWNRLKEKISNSNRSVGRENVRSIGPSPRLRLILRIAAALVFVALTVTVYVFYFRNDVQAFQYATENETREIVLPDSTHVFMNRFTTLACSYSGNRREIVFSGEAYFDVVHDDSKPFVIKANDLNIEDIGTAFNVKALPSGNDVEVLVNEGEVKLTAGINAEVDLNYILRPGQQAVYNSKTRKIKPSIIADTNALAYKTKVFVFENASLPAAIQKLREVYGVEIKYSEELSNCHITATFKNEKIDAIMEVIASTLNLKLTVNEKKYLLEGSGCEQ